MTSAMSGIVYENAREVTSQFSSSFEPLIWALYFVHSEASGIFFFFSIMQEMLNKHFLFTPTNLCNDLCQLDTCNSGSCPPLIQNEIFQGSEMRFVKKVHQLIWHIKSGSFYFYLGTSRLDFASNLEFLLGLGPCQTKLTSALRASDRTIHVSHKNVPEM